MDRILKQSKNGRVFICSNCDNIHVEFNNFLFSFNAEEYDYFKKCFERLDGCYYESINSQLNYKRKIIVPIGHKNASMMLYKRELQELQWLLKDRNEAMSVDYFLSSKEIDLTLGAN